MRHLLPALVLGALLPLAACSNEPEPVFADPTSDAPTSSTPTTEPVVDPPTNTPTEPAGRESAEEFIRRWHRVSDEMQATGDAAEYLLLGPECTPCKETASLIAGYYDAGGYIDYDGTEIRGISKQGSANGLSEYDVALTSPPTKYRERAGGRLRSLPGADNSIRIQLRRSGDSFVVTTYSVLAS